jgi:2-dehydro-3-deoxyphosphogluconate aldolase/(4S)-4-hydroxy-2-oxoglutarate aldolase
MNEFFTKKLLPAVTINEVDAALRLAETYLENGLDVMEITFRTDVTVSAIKAISREFPNFKIGAGTILSVDQVSEAVKAGAQFGLSPGFNKSVVKAAQNQNLPFIPGVATPSEIEQAIELGCKVLKFFPAEPMGGVKTLKALAGPYRHTGIRFIPMGGIDESNMKDYLELDIVVAVGGSWLAPKTRDFKKVFKVVKSTMDIIDGLN